jgi:hypothetical protein
LTLSMKPNLLEYAQKQYLIVKDIHAENLLVRKNERLHLESANKSTMCVLNDPMLELLLFLV